jgi:hypothetical protein
MFTMNKDERAKLIRSLWSEKVARMGVSIGAMGLLSVSRAEIKDEATAVYSQTATDDEIQDEATLGVKSQLRFETVKHTEHEKDSLLSAHERKQLKRELAFRRLNPAT